MHQAEVNLGVVKCLVGRSARQRRWNLGKFKTSTTEKNGFVTATKLGTTDKSFVAATKNLAAATKSFVDRPKHFVVVKMFLLSLF